MVIQVEEIVKSEARKQARSQRSQTTVKQG